MDKRRIEVCGLNGAFYEAHIKSISGNMLAVVYENNPQLEFFVSCDSVRPPPPPHLSCEMTVGDEVEIYSRNSDGEPFGWWLAQIRMMIGEWCLIEYAAGGQEFVLPESIRPFNPNRLCSVETLMRSYCSEERNIRLQVPEREDQACQAGVGDAGPQPAAGAGVEQERIHVTESRSWSLNSLSNEGHSSQPSDSGEHAEANGVCTEESWLSEGGRQDWVLKYKPKPPKVSKSARRRRNRHKPRLQYTLDDSYDGEEIRHTPQGDRLFRLFGSQWVEMA